jgi:YD repeat-containing protein
MMNKTKTLILLLVLLPVAKLFAQGTLNNLGFPSPNNSFLNTVGGGSGVGVDLYTGTAQVNIPLCVLSSRALNIPVSLSYTAGRGVKVQDYATSVGLGWQLSAGGSISRVVRGLPDEFAKGYLGTFRFGRKIKQNLVDNVPLTAADYKAITGWDGLSYVGVTADGEPDIYFLRTPSFNLQFTFDENGNAVFSNETGVKITSSGFFATASYENSTFTVTDPTGNVYTFGGEREKTITTLYGSSYTFTTTWYLTNITGFNAKDNVTFSYTSSSNNDVLNHYQWTRTYYYTGCVTNTSDPIPMTIVQPKYLSSIYCPTGQISFTYAFDRRDITTAARLTSVSLKSTGSMGTTVLKTFGFNYSYFGDPTTDVNMLRLKLDNITMAGGTVATSTPLTYRSFTYNTDQHLPARNSQNFDYWGYYKSFIPYATTDPMTDPTIRSANAHNSKADMLIKIAELGGSTWTINYEGNTFYEANPGSNTVVCGLRVSSISRSLAAGDIIQTQYIYNDATGRSTGQIQTEAYRYLVVNSIDGNCQLLAQKVLSESAVNIYDLNGTFIGYSSVKTVQQNGGYTVCNFQNFSDFGDVFSTGMLCGETNVPTLTSSVSFAHKRGLLKSTIEYTATNEKITEEINSYTGLTSPVAKSGWAYRSYIANASCSGNWSLRDLSSIYYTNIENYRLSGVVRREYDQLTPANYIETATNFTYCANKRTIHSISTTDSKGSTITKSVYHAHDAGIPMITPAEQTVVNTLQSMNNLDAVVHETANRNGAIRQAHYSYTYAFAGSTAPYLTRAASYKGNTLLTTKEMKYETSNVNLVASKETGGKSNSILYGYNNTYPVATVSNADVYLQVHQGSTGFGNGITTSYTQTMTTDYTGTLNWNIYPQGNLSFPATWNYTITGPASSSGSHCMANTGSGTTCPQTITASIPNLPPGTYTLTITLSNGPAINYYITGSYPSNYSSMTREYFYEGFEDNGTAGNAHTGNRYRSSGSYTVSFTPPNTRSYVIQWWKWVNGKWVFNEAPYTGPTTLTGVIDDVRVFPADAQMTTYTYDPMVGKTGEIDPSGRTTTYEFDGLGRMNMVRDNNKNIVSKSCYNFAGQPVACPAATVYANASRSQTFTRNNCPGGYLGTQATYVVPAGTYTSSISQAEADQQAQNDVTTNGQNYANANATCYQVWYNQVQSANFTRNNCGTGSTGSTVTYTIAAGTYMSTVSQADANQQAINALNNGGQAYANANGTCSAVSCTITANTGYSTIASGASASGGAVTFYMIFYPTSGTMYFGASYFIGTISGLCRPSTTRYVTVSAAGRTWQITIYTNGQIYAQITSGTDVPPNSTVPFSSVTFTL